MYLCSTLGLTVDKKLSVHELQPFSRTGETKSSSQNCHSGVKAKSRIPTTPAVGFPLSVRRNLRHLTAISYVFSSIVAGSIARA